MCLCASERSVLYFTFSTVIRDDERQKENAERKGRKGVEGEMYSMNKSSATATLSLVYKIL